MDNTILLYEFRERYFTLESTIEELSQEIGSGDEDVVDPRRVELVGDSLDEFVDNVRQSAHIFNEQEHAALQLNLVSLQAMVRTLYDQAREASHHGRPEILTTNHTGRPGRPSYTIDREFLEWAYTVRSTAGIARFLGVSRNVVRSALLNYGIAERQENPFDPPEEREGAGSVEGRVTSYTRPLSNISDNELDDVIRRLRDHYVRAGVSILQGLLRASGIRVPRERVRHSLIRVDPVRRVFERIRIQRRVYSVAGPNALWHHDGQHGLIRWGIVIHGFIDGYSRMITGLRAHNNNYGESVLQLFLDASRVFGYPSRLRGDHGVENILVAAFMESRNGARRGSYIWGRSVHNVRIERLWVDVTVQVGSQWGDRFVRLEINLGLNVNNRNHLWLLHHLFLPMLNSDLEFFVQGWNHHSVTARRGISRSPYDMFGFDMLVHGVRGERPAAEDELQSEAEMEAYGIDWEGLRDEQVLRSQRMNNDPYEESGSWVGQTGPPAHMNEVRVDTTDGLLDDMQLAQLDELLQAVIQGAHDSQEMLYDSCWQNCLSLCRVFHPQDF